MIEDRIINIEKKDSVDVCGTSYFGCCFNRTVSEVEALLGSPTYSTNNYFEKTQREWYCLCTRESGKTFPITIYNYKDYDSFKEDNKTEWHIGGRNGSETAEALGWFQLRFLKMI